MYLFLQATIQNTRCQLVLFSSSVYYLDYSTSHKAVSITFTNCLQSDILEAVAPKNRQVECNAAHILISTLKYFQITHDIAKSTKQAMFTIWSEGFPDGVTCTNISGVQVWS